jgi:hypothetical protein
MNRPASCGQHCNIGNSESENPSRLITSLQGPERTVFGKKDPQLRQPRQHLDFLEQSLRRLKIDKRSNPLGDLFHALDFQRHIHPPLARKQIDRKRNARSFRALEQQRGSSRAQNALRDFGDLQHRIDFRGNPPQLAYLLKPCNKFPQIPIRQLALPPLLRAFDLSLALCNLSARRAIPHRVLHL